MVIAFHATVHDCLVTLLSYTFTCNVVIYPVWESPHGGVNLSELDWGARVIGNGLLELLSKVTIIEKDVRIVKPAIKVPFDRLY